MIGSHFLKGRARTQNHVALSSAEAELVALVKCSAELLGAKAIFPGKDSLHQLRLVVELLH